MADAPAETVKAPTSYRSHQAARCRVGQVVNVATLILVAVAVAVVRRWADPWVVYVVLAGMAAGYGLTRAERRR